MNFDAAAAGAPAAGAVAVDAGSEESGSDPQPTSSATAQNSPALNPELRAIAQALCLREHLELLQRVVLDLADALPGYTERATHLFQSTRLRARQPEPHLD